MAAMDKGIRGIDARRQAAAIAKLEKFRQMVDALEVSGPGRRFCTDDTLLRYLRARDGDERKALAMLKDSLKWRAKHIDPVAALHADGIPCCPRCAADARAHCFLSVGQDCHGRRVVYSCGAKCINKVPIDNMLHMAFEMERLFAGNAKPGKLVWVIDFVGFGIKDLNPRMCTTSLPMFGAHYPERMGTIVLLDPPVFFYGLYKAALPLLDEVTRNKVLIVRGAKARNAYAQQMWASDPNMLAWMRAIEKCRGLPGSFPELHLCRQLSDRTTVETLERATAEVPSSSTNKQVVFDVPDQSPSKTDLVTDREPGRGQPTPFDADEDAISARSRFSHSPLASWRTLAVSIHALFAMDSIRSSSILLLTILPPIWGWSIAADDGATLEAPLGICCFALGLMYALVRQDSTRAES